jgi:hypothetical protein
LFATVATGVRLRSESGKDSRRADVESALSREKPDAASYEDGVLTIICAFLGFMTQIVVASHPDHIH